MISPTGVTLAIPCFNGARTLSAVLDAVARLAPLPGAVLVVDDGSADGSADMALARGIRVVRHGRNLGLAAARNTALRETTGEILVFLDADCVPEPGLLLALLEGFDAPTVAGVGGQEDSGGEDATRFDRWRLAFRRQSHGSLPLPDVWMLPGLCCAYRREALLAIGGFDPYYRTNGEDVDAGLRLRAAGWRLRYSPGAGVQHLRRDNLCSLLTLCWRYGYWGALAKRRNGQSAVHMLRGQTWWTVVSSWSSLRRHRSLVLAAASPLLGAAGIAGTASGLLVSAERR